MDSLVRTLFDVLNTRTVTTAESCTGGMIASAITALPGSSAYFERSFVTYSNPAKHEMLGVPNSIFDNYGAVSEECALAMARGALAAAKADFSISVTGIAGPGGGSTEKPVGLVYIGIANPDRVEAHKYLFEGNRDDIRAQSVEQALTLVINHIKP